MLYALPYLLSAASQVPGIRGGLDRGGYTGPSTAGEVQVGSCAIEQRFRDTGAA
jgi:hypothetical protein